MSSKQNPIVRVLEFFETASLDASVMVLSLAQAIVRRREKAGKAEKVNAAPPRSHKKKPEVVVTTGTENAPSEPAA